VELSRRELLKLGAAAGVAAALPVLKFAGAGSGGDATAKPNSPAFDPFTMPLGAPPVARPSGEFAPLRFTNTMVPRYDVYQRVVETEMLPGFRTTVRTYTQDPNARRVDIGLGPTFLTRRGRPGSTDGAIVVRQFNQTGGDTTVHLHGGLIASEDDGHPTFGIVKPNEKFDHSYQNDQIAAFMWYHDHAIFETSNNVYHGMAGLYLHSDVFEDSLGLPSGRFDIPLVIQDRAFNADGSLFFAHKEDQPARQGAFGDVICVNGRANPFLTVERRKYRFRLLNGSNARIYNFRLSSGDGFFVIGSEHGFLPKEAETDHVFMSTGERYSIVIDFSKYRAGTRVLLTNDIAPDPYGDPVDGEKVRNIMAFDVVEATGRDDSRVEVTTHPGVMDHFDPARAVTTRTWEFNRQDGFWTVNGLTFDENRVDAHPRANTTEIWHVINSGGGWLHPAHPHLVKARLIDRKPGGVRPWETGLKDMASLGANEEAKMVIFFDAPNNFTSEHSRALYPFHCHNVDHEDHDMMTHWRLEP